jgi:hypothetical protein
MPSPIRVSVTQTTRVHAETPSPERIVPLSLLDATTANFALTNAIWLFNPPQTVPIDFNLSAHLAKTLATTLSAYPQWCGHAKPITTLTGPTEPESRHLPPHARRFGRIYAHFGTKADPGVELVTATSTVTLDSLYPTDRPTKQPLWNRSEANLKAFSPPTTIAQTLQPNEPDETGIRKPLLAIQITELADGSFVLAAKSAHPMADIATLVRFVKDWGSVSRARLSGESVPVLDPVFDPGLLDGLAAGDINADEPDEDILERARRLPMHRFDWWAEAGDAPWPSSVPEIFKRESLEPAGKPMPWKDWDVNAPVSSYIVHLSREQVENLWKTATQDQPAGMRVSKHDAVLAHIWSCVVRARRLEDDDGPVHCNLVLGLRPALQLGDAFIGSPTTMINIEMAASKVAAGKVALPPIAHRIRETIVKASDRDGLAAHLYGVAYEKSPQRIWQAFLGTRHILVTTWARAGIYELDFGLGCDVRYADGVVPDMDGCILIKEAPPSGEQAVAGAKPAWTDHGVDVSIPLRAEDMERLLGDPLLLPKLP